MLQFKRKDFEKNVLSLKLSRIQMIKTKSVLHGINEKELQVNKYKLIIVEFYEP